MKMHRTFLAALGIAGLACTLQPATAQADGPAGQPQGIEILARGPVHEAYAEPATIGGGSRKDFNDMRRQARPTEYGSRGRRFQR